MNIYKNIELILLTLLVFHFDISGKDDNNLQFSNIEVILLTLLVFHFNISGNDNNYEHPGKYKSHIINIISIPFRYIR